MTKNHANKSIEAGPKRLDKPGRSEAEQSRRIAEYFSERGHVRANEEGEACYEARPVGAGRWLLHFGPRMAAVVSHGFVLFDAEGQSMSIEVARNLERPPWK